MKLPAVLTWMIIALCALFALHDAGVASGISSQCENSICRAVDAFERYQTLIGAGIAILAAGIAARPAWRQLQALTQQQNLLTRELLTRRITEFQSNQSKCKSELEKVENEINWGFFKQTNFDEYELVIPNPVLAHNCGHIFRDAAKSIEQAGTHLIDTDLVSPRRSNLVQTLSALSQCCFDIAAPGEYAGDMELTDAQWEKIHVNYAIAEKSLDDRVLDFSRSKRAFLASTERELSLLREQVRSIDRQVLGR